MNIKLSDMVYISLRKMYIFNFTLTSSRWRRIQKKKKNFVNYNAKIIVLLFYIRIAFMPFNSKET